MLRLSTPIVGSKYRPECLPILGALKKGAVLRLERDRDNEHDPMAVAVYSGKTHLGYIPRAQNARIALLLDDGRRAQATLAAEAVVHNGEIKFAPKILIEEI
jgi:hypothetical protein